ncbi:MAG TPA: type VI secretion system baseplate subunit TssE [Gemmatimonadaceae bacterium]
MAKAELERTVQQPLLDRLIDEEPGLAGDPPITWSQSVRQLKLSLRRDLEWLLNTRRIHLEAPAAYEEVRRSLYHYGLPDVSSMSRDSGSDRARLLRNVEDTIATFEPRLTNVRVSLAEGDTSSRRQVHFLIEAMLRMDPNPEPVVFDTVLEVSSGEYQVKGDVGA